MTIDHHYMRETETSLVRASHAAKMLILELNDGVLKEMRPVWGNTNVAVIRFWRDELRDVLWPQGGANTQK